MAPSPRPWIHAWLVWLLVGLPAAAQHPPTQPNAGELLHRIEKLGVVGSVLYLAAHPDDENTRLISYFSNGRKLRTGYLSLTRGDGGQNLIGEEFGDALGIVRTHELLEARRIDGGEQLFTRAVDFGYSKSAAEALSKWGEQEILADVVRAIRRFQPDVIVTRFSTDGSGGHGHHTASALLAAQAFDLAADPAAFPEQISQGLQPWKTERLFFNASTWWRQDLPQLVEREPERWIAVDVGGYSPLLGASYNEIAGKSRSQHKSQGFGAAETRGEQIEYLHLEKGAPLVDTDPLSGIVLDWTRLNNGAALQRQWAALAAAFDPRTPQLSVAGLDAFAATLDRLAGAADATHFERETMARARDALDELCLSCAGVVLELTAARPAVAVGDSLALTASVLQRLPHPAITWLSVTCDDATAVTVGETLPLNRALQRALEAAPTAKSEIDQPFWLARPHGDRWNTDDRPKDIVSPVVSSATWADFRLRMESGREIEVRRSALHRWVDPVAGERTRLFEITPRASIEPVDPIALVRGDACSIDVWLESLAERFQGRLRARAPAGWRATPLPGASGGPEASRSPQASTSPEDSISIEGLRRGERRRFTWRLERLPGATGSVDGDLEFELESSIGDAVSAAPGLTQRAIDHPHLLPQTWYTHARIRLRTLDLRVEARRVGYLRGAGDEVPRALERIGVAVEMLDAEGLETADLARFDAIVTGVRAYNTVDALSRAHSRLLEFAEAGGTLVVQYNTAGNSLAVAPERLGPHPFQITRSRVTVEQSPVELRLGDHPLLTTPNRIGSADFDGWVQERGLYFAGGFEPGYQAPIRFQDPGEAPSDGALIAADVGRGRFVYTGISFFRQLPAGVPGAYRLFANLISRRSPRE